MGNVSTLNAVFDSAMAAGTCKPIVEWAMSEGLESPSTGVNDSLALGNTVSKMDGRNVITWFRKDHLSMTIYCAEDWQVKVIHKFILCAGALNVSLDSVKEMIETWLLNQTLNGIYTTTYEYAHPNVRRM